MSDAPHSPLCWFVESDLAVSIRGPVRASVDTMLCRFFQVEKHSTSEDAKERGTSQASENGAQYK